MELCCSEGFLPTLKNLNFKFGFNFSNIYATDINLKFIYNFNRLCYK